MKNNLKIISIISALMITLSSCSNPMDKTVTEPLSINKLTSILKEHPQFEYIYKRIEKIRNERLTSDLEKAKWSGMTYKRVFDIYEFYKDSLAQTKFLDHQKILDDWKVSNGVYYIKVDSISNYWKNFKKKNSLDNYVKTEVVNVKKVRLKDSYIKRKFNRVVVNITPLKRNISNVEIVCYLVPLEYKSRIENEKLEGKKLYAILRDLGEEYFRYKNKVFISRHEEYSGPLKTTVELLFGIYDEIDEIGNSIEKIKQNHLIITDILHFNYGDKIYSRYEFKRKSIKSSR